MTSTGWQRHCGPPSARGSARLAVPPGEPTLVVLEDHDPVEALLGLRDRHPSLEPGPVPGRVIPFPGPGRLPVEKVGRLRIVPTRPIVDRGSRDGSLNPERVDPRRVALEPGED